MNKPSKPQENTTNPANISFVFVKEINVMAKANTQKENATNNANISNEKENNVMAKTRGQDAVRADANRCRKYWKLHEDVITSFKEIGDAENLTESQVKTSLKKFKRLYPQIKAKMEANRVAIRAKQKAEAEAKRKAEEEAEAKRKAEQEAAEARRKAEEEAEAKRKAEQEAAEARRKASANSRQTKKKSENTSKAKKNNSVGGFVIDASISGVEGIIDDLNRICCTKCKIILTTVTIQELEKMQKFHDNDGKDARRILAMAAGDYDHFECVLIDDTVGTPDDCIIKYCADNKDDVVLLTADKTMELKARAYGIKTHFFRHTPTSFTTIPQTPDDGNHTLHAAREINGKLYICDFENESRSIRVFSNGIEYSARTIELKIGDDVYIATKKFNYVTFAHYQITSLSRVSNCISVYHKRLYDPKEINDLPAAAYKAFMREFKRKVNF